MATECPNCHSPIQPSFVHCKHCGTALPGRVAGESPPEEHQEHQSLEPARGKEEFELGALPENENWQFSREEGWVPTPRVVPEVPARAVEEIRWGGFFRRCGAFIIDLIVIVALVGIMSLMAYVGYKVGLAAHDRLPTFENTLPLIAGLVFAAALLATAYFVMLHSTSGKTIGKSLFKLRVVGADQERIGYGRAFLRWVATVVTAPLVIGFLWIFWSSEKRGWHDFLAGTWVMRS